jgi:hypothetical protein
MPYSETLRAILFAFFALLAALAWLAVRASAIPSAAPARLVAEFGVVRLASLLLAVDAGISIGVAAAREQVPAGALDVALAAGFVALAAVAQTKDPRQALMLLSGGFAGHALLDIAHRPGWLSPELGPHWFLIASAVYDVVAGAICYLPLLKPGKRLT